MWIVRLKIRHDCTIGNRCKTFHCISFSLSLNSWKEGKWYYTSQRHTIEGEKKQVDSFLNDLKNDKRIVSLEISKNTVFFVERRTKKEIPSSFYTPKMFFVKPIYVDKGGFEYWEMASPEKSILMTFVNDLKKIKGIDFTIERFQKTKLDSIYFPKIMPKLSLKQREVFYLAIDHGYYHYPRKIDLGGLARLMRVSTSTCQEHLRRAEQKIMPSIS